MRDVERQLRSQGKQKGKIQMEHRRRGKRRRTPQICL